MRVCPQLNECCSEEKPGCVTVSPDLMLCQLTLSAGIGECSPSAKLQLCQRLKSKNALNTFGSV